MIAFASPQFIWALATLSIPIVVHLYNFRRIRKIRFSNTSLLKQVSEHVARQRQLRRLWLLASRLLFLFFLVMTFAKPFIPSPNQTSQHAITTIYWDNSLSMSSHTETGTTAFDVAATLIRQTIDALPQEMSYRLITNDFEMFSHTTHSFQDMNALLGTIKLSSITRSSDEIIKKIISYGDDSSIIFWFFDGQRSTFTPQHFLENDSTLQWRLIPISTTQQSNVYVDSVYLDNPFAIGGEPNTIKTVLRNTEDTTNTSINVKMIVNNVQVGMAMATIKPHIPSIIDFQWPATSTGLHKGQIILNDMPNTFDNEFYFTLRAAPKVRIVSLYDKSKNEFIANVYGNTNLFDYQSFSTQNVDYSALSTADLIILNSLQNIDKLLADAIYSSSQQGVRLLLIPAKDVVAPIYQRLLPTKTLKLLPSMNSTPLGMPDYNHPFFNNVFAEPTKEVEMPHATPTLSWGIDRSALLHFNNEKPFLSDYQNIFIVASPFEHRYTNFYSHALFVPMMYRLATWNKQLSSRNYHRTTDESIVLHPNTITENNSIRLVGEKIMMPSQHITNGQIVMEIDKMAIKPGFYYALNKSDTIDLVAMNINEKESDLRSYSATDMQVALDSMSNINIFTTEELSNFRQKIDTAYTKKDLWPYTLCLSLLFLLVEALLIRYLK